jgi:hypothetical protein
MMGALVPVTDRETVLLGTDPRLFVATTSNVPASMALKPVSVKVAVAEPETVAPDGRTPSVRLTPPICH